ncbi:myosin-8 isoform X3 [Zootermopsis nevadensis]|uniref:myosin-8 isoform X3 n=1 Tax=Zootermopsis nevadensis TaxID=136037 RepID=UPI000B8EA89B|nr:myosin-8 isoform X3 [Zootermopsis nevadensis]
MEETATTNSTRTKNWRESPEELRTVSVLQAMLAQQRDEMATARTALDSERAAMRALRRDTAAEINAARKEEVDKYTNMLSDLKSRLKRDHEEALQRQKDAITKTLNSEMLRSLKEKDAEMRQKLAEAQDREEMLKSQVRDAVRASCAASDSQQSGAKGGDIQKVQQEVTAQRLQNKQLEQRLQVALQADRQKSSDLRSQHEQHEMQMMQLRKTSQQEIHRLLEELKSKQRTILQLERQVNLLTGRMQKHQEQLVECQHDPRPRECEYPEVNCVRARERRLVHNQVEHQDNMKKVAETQAQEMVEEGDGPLHTDHQLETLRNDIEERDKIIDKLQQAAREKNRRLDQLTNRHRKEQARQFYRQFMELEPVAELEEDSSAEEDSLTSSGSPVPSPKPYPGDMWAELTDKQYHDTLYSCLLKEHLELQREYQFLQTRLKRELAEPNRIRLRLEHELAASRTRVRKLKRMLAEKEGGEAVLTERIAELEAEAHDLHEQNELLEFRILELEECQENSSVRSHGPDMRDVWTDTENDDVSDSGIQSLPSSEDTSSDTDISIHDVKTEVRKEELKGCLLEIANSSSSIADRCCLQQVLALLEKYEMCLEEGSSNVAMQDRPKGGRALQNLSESMGINDSSKFTSRIIATVLPFTDHSVDTNKDINDGERNEIKKQLKNAECLQESGIFEEAEYNCQGTQTDSVIAEPLIEEFKSPFETGVVGDLCAEIQKLNEFRERVEEASNCCGNKRLLRVGEVQGDQLPPDTKELEYCRERLQLLEDKVRVYESSGETQARLLAERLQKEVCLSAQVKELSTKVQHLIMENKRLEEEKCELEEAENDARLKCQKLEVKLVALNKKKCDLQEQLQEEHRTINHLRNKLTESEQKMHESKSQVNYLEVMLNKYEQRNYDLEEHEVDLKHRLQMLENSMPLLLIWNMWKLMQVTGISCTDTNAAVTNALVKVKGRNHLGDRHRDRSNSSLKLSVGECPPCLDTPESSTLQDNEQEQQRILIEKNKEEKMWWVTEEQLQSRLQVLETQAGSLNAAIHCYKESEEKYKKRITELENELHAMKSGLQVPGINTASELAPKTKIEIQISQNQLSKCRSVCCEEIECMKKLQELVQSENDMKEHINQLEKAYMETLQQADKMWSEMENSFKRRISDAEHNEAVMTEKVRKLEESETKLRQAFQHNEENEMLMEKIQNMEKCEKRSAERIHILEAEKHQLTEEINHLREALQSMQMELNKTKEMVAGPLKEELLKERKLSRSLHDEISTMEKESHDRSNAQQTQINCLKVQLSKTSRDLVDLECTNGELKEEVETLEAKVSELKGIIEQQKQNEEKLIIQMSQTILNKEQELEETRREMRFSLTPNAQKELNDVDNCVLQNNGVDAVKKEEILTPAEMVQNMPTLTPEEAHHEAVQPQDSLSPETEYSSKQGLQSIPQQGYFAAPRLQLQG